MHAIRCSATYHPTRCSTGSLSHWNESSCVNRGVAYPVNVRHKCTHTSIWIKPIQTGMYTHENKAIMIKVAKRDTVRLPSWWKLLPIGEYVHSSRTTGFTITKEDKSAKKTRIIVRKATRRPVRIATKRHAKKTVKRTVKKRR